MDEFIRQMNGRRGIFVTFEGIEGSGKSTQSRLLAAFLREKGVRVRLTREPGGSAIGDAIRAILLDPDRAEMAPHTELLLYGASRSQHVHEVLMPALECGEIVICDRFSDATVAYQGHGRRMDKALVRRLDEIASGGLRPDLTFLLDCQVEVGLARSWMRLHREEKEAEESRFEREDEAFHRRVREGYLELAKAEPHRIRIVDGTAPPETVQMEIRRCVLERLGM
jgi:dTMP kinase